MLHRVVLLTPEVVVVYLSLCGGGGALHSPRQDFGRGRFSSVFSSTSYWIDFDVSVWDARTYVQPHRTEQKLHRAPSPPPLFEVHRLAGLVWRGGNVSTRNPYDT